MLTAAIFSAVHILAVVLAFMTVHMRGRALLDGSWGRAFRLDNLWGLSAVLLLATGLWRAFGGLEKGTDYYVHTGTFHLKLTLFVLVVLIELYPMITLIRCRRNESLRTESAARRIAVFGHVESLVLLFLVFTAALMARGVGFSN